MEAASETPRLNSISAPLNSAPIASPRLQRPFRATMILIFVIFSRPPTDWREPIRQLKAQCKLKKRARQVYLKKKKSEKIRSSVFPISGGGGMLWERRLRE
jgi:hypothetical protein